MSLLSVLLTIPAGVVPLVNLLLSVEKRSAQVAAVLLLLVVLLLRTILLLNAHSLSLSRAGFRQHSCSLESWSKPYTTQIADVHRCQQYLATPKA